MESLPYYFEFEPLKKQPFESLMPNTPELAIDLLNKMISLNPKDRITIQEVAEHPFLASGESTTLSQSFVDSLKTVDEVEKLNLK